MHDFSRLKHTLGGMIEEYAEKGRLGGGDMGALNMLADTYKNLCKIEMYEGDSQRGSYEGGGSGRHWVRGHYSRDGGSYDGGSYAGGSYDGGSYGNSYRGYSRHEAKDRMMEQLGEMMRDADPQTREALKHCMRQLENG